MDKVATQREQLLTTFSNEVANKTFKGIRTVDQALQYSRESVGAMVGNGSITEQMMLDGISIMVAQFIDSVNVQTTLRKSQIRQLAADLLEDFNYLKVVDFWLCFKMIRKGEFGDFYSVLSPEKISGWFSHYAAQRSQIAERQSISDHNVTQRK